MIDYLKTVISQYVDSPVLRALLESMSQWKNGDELVDLLYDGVLNLDTARGYGLERWGRIVGVSRALSVVRGVYFGFAQAQSSSISGFGWGGPFYSGGQLRFPMLVDDDGYRTMIIAKAMNNLSDGSAQSYNQILMTLFGQYGQCYVIDGLDMSMVYRFRNFFLPPLEAAIFWQSGVIPRPTGVSATVREGA